MIEATDLSLEGAALLPVALLQRGPCKGRGGFRHVNCPQLLVLLLISSLQTKRKWGGTGVSKEGNSPHIWKLFWSLSLPLSLQILQLWVWKKLAGVCVVKLAVEKVPQKDLHCRLMLHLGALALPQGPTTLARYLNGPMLGSLNFR